VSSSAFDDDFGIAADIQTLRFHILISLMLSSQTKDPITSAAVTNLHLALPGGLTAQSLADASVETVHECINKVGFWRRKTEYIQEAARALLEREGDDKGDVPNTLEGLCELKGVGPKMAFLALQCAWDM
jgi:endonuclease-3